MGGNIELRNDDANLSFGLPPLRAGSRLQLRVSHFEIRNPKSEIF